ncbi:MAG: hypothetical protein A2898_00570 [Candidatus Kerfeldbacteria bacterium RIFCSPLOWO2_01_FULL_48_11]|uniref:Magnesium transporter n=1 Tax=Candidatus Kerfeldbacteria bacterium RIFCSPLOWO2_01_FULL_48_11 TaxID=1798543 RepID=A0A1G2B1F8_9BACT|nr:MAG: Mg2 transporter protein CorA family protein [Parcubacteria group bacterium GW2011_GWA2_48_9]KKW16044.1 MAG: Mg2 transporter protein CorA family protein [Parcubacteria group bacterium GW2011_GWC2_49_9]OGY83004.1 MAG: hypothetical protein A2898_00570 [Candidatus Kerfeldbacteria bacterium RIFCSPLOWO2_01_FULL_48_11]HCM68405.1 hypothetical protein [Candidatus Kerfeldbacteria bacterium]
MSREVVTINKLTWMHVEQVNEDDAKFLREHYKFHPLDIKDCLGVTQRPKLDIYPRYIFLVFHFPYLDEGKRKVRVHELMVFAGRHYLITVTNEVLPSLKKYWTSFVSKSKRAVAYDPLKNNSGYLLYKILDTMFRESLPIVDAMGEKVSDLEEQVYADQGRDTVYNLAYLRRKIFKLRRILEPQAQIVGKLVVNRQEFFSRDLEAYFDDVHDLVEKSVVAVESFRDTLEGLHETNQSLISQRTNDTIKTLTVISVALLPLSVITGYYGMNVVGLPFASHPIGLLIITVVLVAMFLGVIGIARQRRLM